MCCIYFSFSSILLGASNDRFLYNPFIRCFRLSGILLKLCRLILDWAKNTFSIQLFQGNLTTVNARISAQGAYLIFGGERGALIRRGALIGRGALISFSDF